jgi:hypothetical protein
MEEKPNIASVQAAGKPVFGLRVFARNPLDIDFVFDINTFFLLYNFVILAKSVFNRHGAGV